jgi:hypothetical protein
MRTRENRPLSTDESTLLRWLLEHGTERAALYIEQIPNVRVVDHCTCGCPTIDLAVSGEAVSGDIEVLSQFHGSTPEAVPVGVLIGASKGKLSYLEVFCFDENDGPFSLPDISTLKPF